MRMRARSLRALAAAGAVAISVVCVPTAASAFNPQPDPPGRASLEGRVTDACTIHPLDGVGLHLTLAGGDFTSAGATSTNSGGHYLFKGLAAGNYLISASDGSGGAGSQFQVSIPAVQRGVVHLDLNLTPPDPC